MSDHADNADSRIYRTIAAGLAAVRGAPELQADCRCHFCDEAVQVTLLFCDVDCRDDYQREQMALSGQVARVKGEYRAAFRRIPSPTVVRWRVFTTRSLERERQRLNALDHRLLKRGSRS